MTLAICLSCGERRFGALVPCRSCGQSSTGDVDLDVMFSEHRMSPKTLDGFSTVVALIKEESPNAEVGLWSFLKHVSDTYPDVLTIDVPAGLTTEVSATLERVPFPGVTVELREIRYDGPAKTKAPSPKRAFAKLLIAIVVAVVFLIMVRANSNSDAGGVVRLGALIVALGFSWSAAAELSEM